jgi:hypothetical protein
MIGSNAVFKLFASTCDWNARNCLCIAFAGPAVSQGSDDRECGAMHRQQAEFPMRRSLEKPREQTLAVLSL